MDFSEYNSLDYTSFDSDIGFNNDIDDNRIDDNRIDDNRIDLPQKLSPEAQCVMDALHSVQIKKQRLHTLINEITEIQKSVDAALPEFEDVRDRVNALTAKYVNTLTAKYEYTTMDFDILKKKLEMHVTFQRARLQELQPERDTLAADIGMIEKSLASVVEKSSNTCSVCYDRKAEVALKPCGHVYCESCVARIDTRRCPKCRDLINGQLKLYF